MKRVTCRNFEDSIKVLSTSSPFLYARLHDITYRGSRWENPVSGHVAQAWCRSCALVYIHNILRVALCRRSAERMRTYRNVMIIVRGTLESCYVFGCSSARRESSHILIYPPPVLSLSLSLSFSLLFDSINLGIQNNGVTESLLLR